MRQKAPDNVVGDGFHVVRGCFCNKAGHVQDVAGEKAGFGATHTLLVHDFLDASWGEPVGGNGVVQDSKQQREDYEGKDCEDHHGDGGWEFLKFVCCEIMRECEGVIGIYEIFFDGRLDERTLGLYTGNNTLQVSLKADGSALETEEGTRRQVSFA